MIWVRTPHWGHSITTLARFAGAAPCADDSERSNTGVELLTGAWAPHRSHSTNSVWTIGTVRLGAPLLKTAPAPWAVELPLQEAETGPAIRQIRGNLLRSLDRRGPGYILGFEGLSQFARTI